MNNDDPGLNGGADDMGNAYSHDEIPSGANAVPGSPVSKVHPPRVSQEQWDALSDLEKKLGERQKRYEEREKLLPGNP